ncbi:MAG TPA: hypothetical protein VGN17_17730 [Bryobacteraceae bacterium]|jgi:hypothetical protein
MKNNRVATIFALALVGALIAYFPPGPFSWRTFLLDPSSNEAKLMFLAKVYLAPALLSMVAVVGFRVQMGLSMTGAAPSAVFPLALLASGAMMAGLRSMSGGVGGVPGYAVGMSLGYTLMANIYGFKKTEQTVFGRPVLKIVWRKQALANATPVAQTGPGVGPASSAVGQAPAVGQASAAA